LVLATFHRNTCKHVTRRHLVTRPDRQDRVDGQQVSGHRRRGDLGDLALVVLDTSAGFRSAPRGVARQSMTTFGDHRLTSSVDSCTDSAVDEVFEIRKTVDFGQIGRV
jgi:hypothetical protein